MVAMEKRKIGIFVDRACPLALDRARLGWQFLDNPSGRKPLGSPRTVLSHGRIRIATGPRTLPICPRDSGLIQISYLLRDLGALCVYLTSSTGN